MEWDSERIQEQVFETIGGHYSNADASTVKLEIFLLRYRNMEGEESGPVNKVILSHDTWRRTRMAPDIPELRAVRDVFELLEEASQ